MDEEETILNLECKDDDFDIGCRKSDIKYYIILGIIAIIISSFIANSTAYDFHEKKAIHYLTTLKKTSPTCIHYSDISKICVGDRFFNGLSENNYNLQPNKTGIITNFIFDMTNGQMYYDMEELDVEYIGQSVKFHYDLRKWDQ